MKKLTYIVLMLLIISPVCRLWAGSSEPVTLKEVLKPAMMVVKDNKLYVLQQTTIFIYSLKDFKLIKTFGRQGEGPREFMARPYGAPMSMSFADGKLVVSSLNKVSYFTKLGEYVSERKAPANSVYYQFHDQFIAVGPTPADKMVISFRLNSNDYKFKKTLYLSDVSVIMQEKKLMPLSALTYNPVAGKVAVLVTDPDQFIVDVFDKEGNKIKRIEKKVKRMPMTSEFKSFVVNWFKTDPQFKPLFERIKPTIAFRSHFPAIRTINLSEENVIAVLTFKRKGDLWECLLMDYDGKVTGKAFIPLSAYKAFTYYATLFSVENGKIYSLVEDEDEEVYKLHITTAK